MGSRLEFLDPFWYKDCPSCFPLGRDSLELGRFAAVKPGWRVCDLGCGGGVLLLLLAGRAEKLELTGVELDGPSAQAARENLARNGLSGTVRQGDLQSVELPAGSFDLVVSNPPYFAQRSGRSGGGARMEERCTLAELCKTAGRLLKYHGRFALVHRPERLAEIVCALRRADLEPKRMQILQHSASHPPFALLMEGVKRGRPGLELLPVKILTNET